MAQDGLGFAGPGGGMINRLFDAGLTLGVDYGNQQLGIATGANQASRLGLTQAQLNAATTPQPASGTIAGMDQKTVLIGAALIIGAIVLAKVL